MGRAKQWRRKDLFYLHHVKRFFPSFDFANNLSKKTKGHDSTFIFLCRASAYLRVVTRDASALFPYRAQPQAARNCSLQGKVTLRVYRLRLFFRQGLCMILEHKSPGGCSVGASTLLSVGKLWTLTSDIRQVKFGPHLFKSGFGLQFDIPVSKSLISPSCERTVSNNSQTNLETTL